jgi:hypothetical protein
VYNPFSLASHGVHIVAPVALHPVRLPCPPFRPVSHPLPPKLDPYHLRDARVPTHFEHCRLVKWMILGASAEQSIGLRNGLLAGQALQRSPIVAIVARSSSTLYAPPPPVAVEGGE